MTSTTISGSLGTTTDDSNGNTLTSTTGSNTTTYAWDFENRLASVTLPGSGGTVSFKYDPFGRRPTSLPGCSTPHTHYSRRVRSRQTNAN